MRLSRFARLSALLVLITLFAGLFPVRPAFAAVILNLSISRVGSGPVQTGTVFKYRLTYECSGSVTDQCINMRISSPLPAPLTGVTLGVTSDIQSTSLAGNIATWNFKSPLPQGTTGVVDFEVRFPNGTTPDGTVVTPTATFSATGAVAVAAAGPPAEADAVDRFTVTKTRRFPSSVGSTPAQYTTYRIAVCVPSTNGTLNLTNAIVTDTLPSGTTVITANPASFGVAGTPPVISWTTPQTVTTNTCRNYDVTVDFPTSDASNVIGGQKVNTAFAAGVPLGGSALAKSHTITHTLQAPQPIGNAAKSASNSSVYTGTSVYYTIQARNTGNTMLSSMVITDMLPPAFNPTSVNTGLANSVDYQKNGLATWISGVVTGSNVLTTSLPGFTAGDYVSALRFTFNDVPVGFDNNSIRINGTVVKPANDGIDYTLPYTFGNMLTYSIGTGIVSSTGLVSVTAIPIPPPPQTGARPNPAKTVVGSPAIPGDVITYTLTINNQNVTNTLPISEPVLADLLPNEVEYIDNSWATTGSTPPACSGANAPVFTRIDNYNGTGRTLLLWSWNGTGCSVAQNQSAPIRFNVRVRPTALPGSYANRLTLVNYDNPPADVIPNCNATSDPSFVDGNGVDTSKLCQSPGTSLVIGTAASIASEKLVRGQLDSVFHRDPLVGRTIRGGLLTYNMAITNTGNVTFTNLELIDILPYNSPAPGNVGVRDQTPLGTAWRPQLSGEVQVSPPIPGLVIYYSSELNPCRPALTNGANPGCTTMVEATSPGPGIWSTNIPADPTTVRSLKFKFGSYELGPAQAIRFTFPMFAPLDAPLAGAGADGIFGNSDDVHVAWNTFAYTVQRIDDLTPSGRLVAQPPRVGIEVTDVPAGMASYGDYVWHDANRNGTQDEPATQGINGVGVRLYSDADGNPATTGDQTFFGAKVTTDDANGNPGYYLFPGLTPGYYFAEFDMPAGYDSVTGANQGGDDTQDSDVDPLTMRSHFTQLSAGQDYRDTDLGVYGPAVSLGNRVWLDLDNDGLDDDGASASPGSSTGIDGVRVELFRDSNGNGMIDSVEQTPLAVQLTGADGFYLFTQTTNLTGALSSPAVPLLPGNYVVGVAPLNFQPGGVLAGFRSSTAHLSGTLLNEDTPADPDTGGAVANPGIDYDDSGETIGANAAFYAGGVLSRLVRIDAGEPLGEPATPGHADVGPLANPIPDARSNLTLDFGFSSLSLGNLVWRDDDNNGHRNGAEPGLAGITVALRYADGTAVLDGSGNPISTTTNAYGHYLFSGLAAGDYLVELDAANFAAGAAYAGYTSSTGSPGSATGTFEPAADPDSNTADSRDNGTRQGSRAIRSAVITLEAGGEPANSVESEGNTISDPAPDRSGNWTVDFGVFQPGSIGSVVWLDTNKDGLRDQDEPGLSAVTVTLYSATGVVLATTTTAADGTYLFPNLPPASYRIHFSGLPSGTSFTTPGQGNSNNDSDADPGTGFTPLVSLSPGQQVLTVFAGAIPAQPTAVLLSRFTAGWQGEELVLNWATSLERNSFGFHVLRSSNPNRSDAERITVALIPARGSGQGATYTWHDSTAQPGVAYSYWLEETDLDGTTREYGPLTVRAEPAGQLPGIYLPLMRR